MRTIIEFSPTVCEALSKYCRVDSLMHAASTGLLYVGKPSIDAWLLAIDLECEITKAIKLADAKDVPALKAAISALNEWHRYRSSCL